MSSEGSFLPASLVRARLIAVPEPRAFGQDRWRASGRDQQPTCCLRWSAGTCHEFLEPYECVLPIAHRSEPRWSSRVATRAAGRGLALRTCRTQDREPGTNSSGTKQVRPRRSASPPPRSRRRRYCMRLLETGISLDEGRCRKLAAVSLAPARP